MELNEILDFIRSLYRQENYISLHEPVFNGNEKRYVLDTIESTFVSSIGQYVNRFENIVAEYTGAKHSIALVNGTQALFLALKLMEVNIGDEVVTQSLSFVATSNAISYTGARPVYIDVDEETMGMSPKALRAFLKKSAKSKNGACINAQTGRRIKVVLPVHVCGHPCRIEEIADVCQEFGIELLEDAAESLGSWYKDKHTGTFGKAGILSFNGNKVITTGGGGMLLTNDSDFAKKAKHLSTTAKIVHSYEYIHDDVGYNYRLPNINAALGVAQMERLPSTLQFKRDLAMRYRDFFKASPYTFFDEPMNSHSNYWLNVVLFRSKKEKEEFLGLSIKNKIMSRSVWRPIHCMPVYADMQTENLKVTNYFYDCAVHLSSGLHYISN